MAILKVGGVPEHFNLPIILAKEAGFFEREGIQIEWKDFGGGTGAMTKALREDDCDICILLTEGIIKDIIQGNPAKIISGYVKSPLNWGIHTHKNGLNIIKEDQLFNQKIAISRYGSGSHLMPIVNALLEGKRIDEEQFVEVKDIEGGIQSLTDHEAAIFYWEKYTTKPRVTAGELYRIGEFISPWPCFMIAATDRIIKKHPDLLDIFLRIVHKSCEAFMKNIDAPQMVSNRYGIKLRDAEYWFHSTEWSVNSWVSDKILTSVLFALKEAQIVHEDASTKGLIWERNKN